MNIEEFWKLIDATREASDGDISKQANLLVEILVHRPVEEICAFDTLWNDVMDNAYDAALWDACDIIGCGCSDDGFWDFRGWLIAQGRKVYEDAIADPQSLLDLIDVNDDGKYGALIYVAMTAYEQRTGQDMPPKKYPAGYHHPQLKGTHWPQENREARFPKLEAKFGDCDKRWRKWMAKDFPDKT